MAVLLTPVCAEMRGYDSDSSNLSCSTRRINSGLSASTGWRLFHLRCLIPQTANFCGQALRYEVRSLRYCCRFPPIRFGSTGSAHPIVSADIVIAEIEGEFTVKRLLLTPRPALQAMNPDFPSLYPDPETLQIFGVVTAFIHKTRRAD